MFRSLIACCAVAAVLPVSVGCHGLALGDDVVIVRPFAPVGNYAGHWGIDLAADIGSEVQAIGGGTVSFAGSVAGRKSVTIDHGGGIRTSYSYLSNIFVSTGRSVARGTTIGSSGVHHARNAFHLSLRSGLTYLDPLALGQCSSVPGPGLWLTDARSG